MSENIADVAIIIVNWNGWRDTIECVNSCQNFEYKNFKIIIVDNNSGDDSEKILRQTLLFSNITIIQSGANLGFTGGNNVGIQHALLDNNIKYIWLLNNDTIVDTKALGELLLAIQDDSSIGIVGSKIFYYNSKKLWFAGGAFNKYTGYTIHLGLHQKDSNEFSVKKDIDFISGCSLLISVAVLKKIGLLNNDYFLYFEDTDWNFKVKESGFRIVYVPSSIVWHKISQSVKQHSHTYYYYIFRNSLLFAKRHLPQSFLFILGFRCLEIINYFVKGNIKATNAATKGVLDFCKNKLGQR